MMRKAEAVIGGPVEIEWALDDAGFKLLQARPLTVEPITVPDDIWLKHPGLNGHPAGIGWGAGRAVVVNCECELSRVAPGDVLVTRVAGPALSHVLPRVAGRGRGARRIDLASRLARARARHPDGAGRTRCHQPHPRRLAGRGRRRRRCRAMDRLMPANSTRPRIFVTQPIAKSAIERLRKVGTVKVNPDSSRIIAKKALVAAVRTCDILFCLLHDRIDRDVIAANPKLRLVAAQSISPSNIDVAAATAQRLPVTWFRRSPPRRPPISPSA
jgi:hypothetical protein